MASTVGALEVADVLSDVADGQRRGAPDGQVLVLFGLEDDKGAGKRPSIAC